MSALPTISKRVNRRFILGKSGLWPGRRYQGKAGAADSIRAIGGVQIDPLIVIARNHDLKLASRVIDYTPDQLDSLMYSERQFFDYGGWLHLFPMEELPYWRLHMARHLTDPYWMSFLATNQALIDLVRGELRTRGALRQRDLSGQKVDHYRAGKDAGLAMYYLWRIGELMTSGRSRFDRLYDFTENVAPADYRHSATEAESIAYFERKAFGMGGLQTATAWKSLVAYFTRETLKPTVAKARLNELIDAGIIRAVLIEGGREAHYLLDDDWPLLQTLIDGHIPDAWQALDATTEQEVTFLAPLDPVSARGRSAKVFDFEYKWEVYTPAPKRQFGYYVLPILYGDELVARADFKLDRAAKTLRMLSFYVEKPETATDKAFGAALARGLRRFARFHEAEAVDVEAVQPAALRKQLMAKAKQAY